MNTKMALLFLKAWASIMEIYCYLCSNWSIVVRHSTAKRIVLESVVFAVFTELERQTLHRGGDLLHFHRIWHNLDWQQQLLTVTPSLRHIFISNPAEKVDHNETNHKNLPWYSSYCVKHTFFPEDTHGVCFHLITFYIHSKTLLKNNLFKCSLETSSGSLVSSAEM